jgi:hypothetical protein
VPPAFPPPDSARSLDTPSADGGLRVEADLLRETVVRLTHELSGLQQAMATRAVIDQAKGAIRTVTGVSNDEAFTLLATRSQNTNRKLSTVALDVLAAVDSDVRPAAVLSALQLPDPRPQPADGDGAPPRWRSLRRWDPVSAGVTDRDQLLAVADLGEQLASAPDRAVVVDVLLRGGAEALGAFAATFATVQDGAAAHEVEGISLGDDAPDVLPLDADHPVTEALRTGRTELLSRPELALRYPAHPRPERLRGMAVIPVARDTGRPAVWSLLFDHGVPSDRSSRAMLDRAGRLATGALSRAV